MTPPFRYETPKESPSSPNQLATTDDKSLVGKKATEQETKGKEIEQEKGDEANQAHTRKQTGEEEKEEDKQEEAIRSKGRTTRRGKGHR